ncbi:hypothetical protein MP638_000341 [Amoeboaphelidium occidentale]|nr:hypothetical protein MP638_000341 [Amoeboaphelidium occidentale]
MNDPFANAEFEVKAKQENSEKPLISEPKPLNTLIQEEFNKQDNDDDDNDDDDDDVFTRKLQHLSKEFPTIIRTRGDGNCFYRCVLHEYLTVVKKLSMEVIEEFTTLLKKGGFSELAYEDFLDELKQLQLQPNNLNLRELLNNQYKSNALVVLLRFLTSAYLKVNYEEYHYYITPSFDDYDYDDEMLLVDFPDDRDRMTSFCVKNIEAMDKEADELMIIALSKCLQLKLGIVYLDSNKETLEKTIIHKFNYDSSTSTTTTTTEEEEEEEKDVVYLLYRPGHYDILRKSESE